MASAFRNIIEFFNQIGIYDVVLPFLLVFVIVFAILEKTKVFGTEEIGGQKYPKKNLDAMAAFVIALLVVLSSKLVEIITKVSSQVVILLLLSVLFLLVIGSFYKEGEPVFLEGGWKTFFMFLMFIGIAAIFLNTIKDNNGNTWLSMFWGFVSNGSGGNAVGSIILLVVIILAMAYAIRDPNKSVSASSGDKGAHGGH